MIRKSKYIISAWISLMVKSVNASDKMGLKEILFKKEEIILEAEKMILPKRISSAEFAILVNGHGNDEEKYFSEGPRGSLSEYLFLTKPSEYVEYNPQEYVDILYDCADLVGVTLDKHEILRILENYYRFITDVQIPEQREQNSMIARHAVWLAAAVLTYNDWIRTNTNQADFWYRQKTIAYTAFSFNSNNSLDTCRQMAGKDCTLGKSSQGYTFFTGDGNMRRLTRTEEAENTIPDCPEDYEIASIMGTVSSGELMGFIRNIYSAGNIIMDISVSYDEQERQAFNLSDDSLYRAAVMRSSLEIPSSLVETNRYYRDPYISHYVKRIANGKCQLCQKTAPFISSNGEPYLEVHHIEWLSQGGRDSLGNVVALCPNCHRKMHNLNLQEDKEALLEIAETLV